MTDSSALLMDRIYAHQRHFYDLTRKPYLLGRDRLIAELRPPRGGTVLEIGCGTGRNLIHAARRYRNATFFGIDVSQMMLATARQSISRSGLGDRIALAQADAVTMTPSELFGQAAFDRVFISYALSMIPAWRPVLSAAIDLLAPNGALHVVDFGDQRGLPRWFRALLFQWLLQFSVTPRTDIEHTLSALARWGDISYQLTPLYRGYAVYAAIERSPSNDVSLLSAADGAGGLAPVRTALSTAG